MLHNCQACHTPYYKLQLLTTVLIGGFLLPLNLRLERFGLQIIVEIKHSLEEKSV